VYNISAIFIYNKNKLKEYSSWR